MLWIALELPALPLQVVERAGASREPLAIAEGPVQRPLVCCANEAARAAGVRAGQAIAAARALASDLKVSTRDPGAERETLERLAAWAGQFTPMACLDGQGITLEVGSSLRLFGGHARLTSALRQGVRDLGYQACLGIAPTPLAARLFARAEARGRTVRACIEAADLPERVADMPLFLLDWEEKTLARLVDLGVLRLRDVLQLPVEGLSRRFGPEMALCLAKLMGRVGDPRVPYAAPPRFRSRLELPAEAEGVEALLFPLKRLLAEFEGTLRGRGAGVQQLSLVLEHGRRDRTRVALEFASAEREAGFILGIAREKLGRLTLKAPTHALVLAAEALLPYVPRESTWLPGAREQAMESERLRERLVARLGKERVFGIALAGDHRPEKNWARSSDGVTQGARGHPGEGRGPNPQRPTWLLQRPQRLITQAGRPTLQGALTIHAGPERIESGWWDGDEVRRDYFVASNVRGETCWIYREHRDLDAWYLHGLFA